MSNPENIEIELKYILLENQIEQVVQWLDANAMFVGQKRLENLYFDTPDAILNKNRIGLRVRRWPGGSEQTVKFAGTAEGALSKRPEYNMAIESAVPDLNLFERDIWPEGVDLQKETARLQLQFEVTFERRYWVFEAKNGQLEISIDQGAIHVAGASESIQELELEMKHGSEDCLFEFSQLLTSNFKLSPGEKSKAQRGFELMQSQSSQQAEG